MRWHLYSAVKRRCTFLYKALAAKLDLHKTVRPVSQVDNCIALQSVLVQIMAYRTEGRLGIHTQIAYGHNFKKPPERPQIVHKVAKPDTQRRRRY